MHAQLRARVLRDRALEVRALNVCGAIALERGGLTDATFFFTRAQEEATQDNDMATVGRCANNLGIIARSEEHTSELQSQSNLVCRLLLEKKKKQQITSSTQLSSALITHHSNEPS